MIILHNEALLLRTLEQHDAGDMLKWLNDPAVLQYYEGRDRPLDAAQIQESFYDVNEDEVRCIIQWDDVPIGYLQFYEITAEEKIAYGYEESHARIVGMDQFIGETSYWNRGIGTELITAVLAYLKENCLADLVVMDPQTWNTRALHVYEKCGFEKKRLLPKREWHEGEYRDCWLIEKKLID